MPINDASISAQPAQPLADGPHEARLVVSLAHGHY